MIQNFIIVRDGETFQAKEPMPFIEFNCSYGWEHKGASNKFSVKTNYTGKKIQLGDFIQLGTSNWCGQVLNIDIDFKEKTALYTGDSLYRVVDHFVPVRTAETIDSYSIKWVDTWGHGRSESEPRLQAIINNYADKWTTRGLVTRANELLQLAHFPLVIGTRNTYPGNIVKPNATSWLDAYDSYLFASNDPTSQKQIIYGSDGNIYRGSLPPAGVEWLLSVMTAAETIVFNSKTPLMKSFEDRLDYHSYTTIQIERNNITLKDEIIFSIQNRFFEDGEDTILLDKHQSPIYYHEKMSENMAAFPMWSLGSGEAIVGNTRGLHAEPSYAPNDIDYNSLEYASSYAKGGKIFYYIPEAEDVLEGRNEYEAFIKEQKLTYDHSLEIYDDEYRAEFEVGKTYRLLSFEAGVNVKADLYEKVMTATPNGTKVTYNFRENIEEEEE